ncbi:hypothetical protein EPO44_19090 [bacterium]|nr:MAG: hypothetical protein EPO44_19090 [bacterium]
MGEKIPRFYGYIIAVLILAIGAILAWKYIPGAKNEPGGRTASFEEKNQESDEKDRQIQVLNNQMAQLRKELEESSNKVAELQARLDDTSKALSSTEQKLRKAMRQAERPASTPPQPQEKIASKPKEPASPPSWKRPAEPGSYEIIRPTAVFAEPSDSSRRVSNIQKGTRVTVVGSMGEWLEVRSKHGNPPGFIRRDDAMFVEKQD